MLSSIELPEIKKIIEEAISNQFKFFAPPVEQKTPKLLTRSETAKFLCISLPTLHDWTKNGIISAHRIGNRVLYKANEINDSLKQIKTSNARGGCYGN